MIPDKQLAKGLEPLLTYFFCSNFDAFFFHVADDFKQKKKLLKTFFIPSECSEMHFDLVASKIRAKLSSFGNLWCHFAQVFRILSTDRPYLEN